MAEPIYFSRVQFYRYEPRGVWSLLDLDIKEKRIAYQEYKRTWLRDESWMIVRNGKTGFQRKYVQADPEKETVTYSDAEKISEEKMEKLLPYCNALEFEQYRDRDEMEGWIGYRDECNEWFVGITDSCIPKMEWSMGFIYDEAHNWPSERLYQHLVKHFFKGKLKG